MDPFQALAFSGYATRALAADPALSEQLAATCAQPFNWDAAPVATDIAGDPKSGDPESDDPEALGLTLRALRRRVFLHTMLRDLMGLAPLTEVCGTMTRLAEYAVGASVSLHSRLLSARFGEPMSAEDGTRQALIVLGMGKLGGGELNVSSDIDLILVYPDEGETAGPRKLANREFFDRLGQRVIATLHEVTPADFVFRVDMRLRPYGESGPLTTTLNGLETYLVTQGRAWERYAWLKARALTGIPSADAQGEIDALVVPFVFRKYLDYDAYDGLRDVHRQIRDQGARLDHLTNVKLGEGGIREIEFIVQALQIVRGGREPGLRVRGTLPALAALKARALLTPAAAAGLRDAYVFLRRVEHRLQYRDDQQTHTLPEDPNERALLAEAMAVGSLREFDAELQRHRDQVSEQFAQVFGDRVKPDAGERDLFIAAWEESAAATATHDHVTAHGYSDADALFATLGRVRASSRYLQLPALSRQRFDTLMPQLLAVAAANPGMAGAQLVFGRLLALLEAVSRRSAYLALVIEHPPLLPRIAQLMAASAWGADYLTQHPLLLDELLDARVLLAEPDWDAWRDELARQMAAHAGDVERQMDTLRHFHDAQTFRLLAQDLGGRMTVERLADHVSALADVLLAATLRACWVQTAGVDAPPPRFAIIGYGKLGGKELGYASDLDLVFLYNVDGDDPDAEGKTERYARLAQRLITWLTSNTAAGQLYDTDLRLRPDGASGLLVSSLSAFRKYQRDNAWTWEHQALTRARFVAGDPEVGKVFEAERDSILRLPRDAGSLAAEVTEMRRKMAAGHPNRTALFDLKHDPGGMVDIEFAVQYLVLAHAHLHPELTRNAGNIALLGMSADLELLPSQLAAEVADAYRGYRRLQHQVRLTGAPHARVEPASQAARRSSVEALWRHVFGGAWEPLDRHLKGAQGEIG